MQRSSSPPIVRKVSLQYKLVRDKIGHLYSEFNDNYETFYIGVVRDTLIRVAAEYEASERSEGLGCARSGSSMAQGGASAARHAFDRVAHAWRSP